VLTVAGREGTVTNPDKVYFAGVVRPIGLEPITFGFGERNTRYAMNRAESR